LEELARRALANSQVAETNLDNSDWRQWLATYFPRAAYHPMPEGGRHARLWEWMDALTPGVRPLPRGEYWPRGGAKSTVAELGCVFVGTKMVSHDGETRPARRFVLYVSGTQDQANQHVETIRQKFEDIGVDRHVGKYGHSKGWKVDLLRTSTGFNVLALGLDAASRGVKLDDFRPDWVVLDDVDGRHDTSATVAKKIATITESILPAGANDCAILFIQNLIHKGSIASQLENNTADFLLSRDQVPAEPAIVGLQYERFEDETGKQRYRITEGEATWAGQDIATCEQQLNDWGRAAFEREAQHKVDEVEDGLWQRERDIEPFRFTQAEIQHLKWLRVGVAIDPSWATGGDEAGIIGGAIAEWKGQLHGFVLSDKSIRASAKTWAQAGVDLYHELGADVLLGEGNFMGEMVKSTIATVDDAPPVKIIYVSRGKLIRAEPVQKLCEDGRLHFPMTPLHDCEHQLCTYRPGMESPGRMDALVILFSELMLNKHTIEFSDAAKDAIANI